jgi:hypothetical protein
LRISNLYEPKLMSRPCSRRADFKYRFSFAFSAFFAVELLWRMKIVQTKMSLRYLSTATLHFCISYELHAGASAFTSLSSRLANRCCSCSKS